MGRYICTIVWPDLFSPVRHDGFAVAPALLCMNFEDWPKQVSLGRGPKITRLGLGTLDQVITTTCRREEMFLLYDYK